MIVKLDYWGTRIIRYLNIELTDYWGTWHWATNNNFTALTFESEIFKTTTTQSPTGYSDSIIQKLWQINFIKNIFTMKITNRRFF